ncbi:MAG TPA: hypothetical protein P5227_08315, partial [Emcibacteraceae bacterium]|nr:hypothetical protein [Emcibacteraceae bacterium]
MTEFCKIMSQSENENEIEVADGVFVRRRTFLIGGLSSTLLGGLMSSIPLRKVFAQSDTFSYEQFLSLANPLAKSLVGDTSTEGQDQYLHSLAAIAARIKTVPEPVAWNDSTQSFKPGTDIGFTPGGDGFTVLHWRMAPNTQIRLHRHDYGNVVTIGLGGDARVENYEIADNDQDYIPGKSFRVRKTVDQQLTPGNINLVSLDRNYIHGFTAGPDGAHGLDITTRIRPKPDHGTPYLSVSSNAAD